MSHYLNLVRERIEWAERVELILTHGNSWLTVQRFDEYVLLTDSQSHFLIESDIYAEAVESTLKDICNGAYDGEEMLNDGWYADFCGLDCAWCSEDPGRHTDGLPEDVIAALGQEN